MLEGVWVTGMGVVSSIGIGRDAFWDSALKGRSGGRLLEQPVLSSGQFGTRVAAPVVGFSPDVHLIPPHEVRITDIATRFAVAAAHEAVLDAGLEPKLANPRRGHYQLADVAPERLGVIIGSGIGGFTTFVETMSAWHKTHRRTACKRYAVPMIIPNAAAANVAIRFQARGECKGVSAACASGSMAIGDAFRLLRAGEADVVICGATEAILADPELFGLLGFDLLNTMTRRNDAPTKASRPFDRDRDGYLLSEGAGVLVLERASFARSRGARPYGRIAGYAATCDASRVAQIDPVGTQVERVMVRAMQNAGIEPADVDYINAHGTATVMSDRVESKAIRSAFGPHADALAVSSLKSMTGHPVAASGALGAISTLLTIRHGWIPPTVNLDNPDPECDLDYVPHTSREATVDTGLVNTFGFGGHNACLVLTRT